MSPELPDVIIQHIHSFLNTREAAETMLVSKSWLRAWSTRPVLVFDNCLETKNEYTTSYRYRQIPSHVIDRTLQSYVDQGIPIVRFHLNHRNTQERWLKMARQCNVVDLHLGAGSSWTASMFQEIFATQSLQVLSIAASRSFDFLTGLSHLDITCLKLRKLQFQNLLMPEVNFHHIMSSCPLIQELLLTNCDLIGIPSYNIGIQSSMFAGKCASFKRLSLVETQINNKQLHTILSNSPQLEDLKLIRCCKLVTPINLSSVSLKRVNLVMSELQVALIDAPNLHKLKFSSGSFRATPFPITITSPVTKGVVKATINYHDSRINESWFHGLKDFLVKFAKLNIKFTSYYSYPLSTNFELLRTTQLPPRHEVETLRFKEAKDLPLLYAFISICHPKIVLIDRLDTIAKRKHLIEFLKHTCYRGNLESCNSNYENKCWRHYMKDAKLYYKGRDNEKKPLDMKGLEMGLGSPEMITLSIEWESSH